MIKTQKRYTQILNEIYSDQLDVDSTYIEFI